MKTTNVAVLPAALLLWSGCGETRTPKGQQAETKPQPIVVSDSNVNKLAVAPPVIRANYSITIRAKEGQYTNNNKVCEGNATLLVTERSGGDYDVDLSNPQVKCLGGDLDISMLLAGLLKKGSSNDSGNKNDPGTQASSTNGVMSFGHIFGATWTPPRPVVVGPIVQETSRFDGLDRQASHIVVTDGTNPKSSSGTIRVRVHETGITLPSTLPSGKKLDKIMHWSIKSEGFSGAKRANLFLFDDFHVFINTRPIVIAKVVVSTTFDDILGASGASDFGGTLMKVAQNALNVTAGKAEIELEVIDWNAQ